MRGPASFCGFLTVPGNWSEPLVAPMAKVRLPVYTRALGLVFPDPGGLLSVVMPRWGKCWGSPRTPATHRQMPNRGWVVKGLRKSG